MAKTLARRLIAPFVVSCGFLLTSDPRAQTSVAAPPSQTIQAGAEELIAEKPPACPALDDEDVASRDGRKVAWRCRANDRWTVFVNGVPQGGGFEEAHWLTFSPDGQHVAFAARHDKRWTIVEDGKERPTTYEEVGPPVYSDDGKHIVHAAKATKKWMLVMDGEPRGGEFDDILSQSLSPDGQRVAYVGRRRNKFVVVLDGKEGTPFDIVGGIGFSSDSRRFAYAGADVNRGFGKQKAVGRATIDGTAGPTFEGAQIGSLLKNFATSSTPYLLVGYLPQLLSDTHGVTAPVFSPDGRRVAYAVRRDKDTSTVIVDGEPGPVLPSIVAGPVFSPDSQHVAVVISEGDAKILVVDGVKTAGSAASGADFIVGLAFAANNRRGAYIGIDGGNMYEQGYTRRARRRVYVDGTPGPEYNALYLGQLQFTPDGAHVTYVVGLAEKPTRVAFVVVDRLEGKRYDDVFSPVRVAEGARAIIYTAQAGRRLFRVTQPLEQTAP
jgi:hypothetical protein